MKLLSLILRTACAISVLSAASALAQQTNTAGETTCEPPPGDSRPHHLISGILTNANPVEQVKADERPWGIFLKNPNVSSRQYIIVGGIGMETAKYMQSLKIGAPYQVCVGVIKPDPRILNPFDFFADVSSLKSLP